jgi:hypothetical protein
VKPSVRLQQRAETWSRVRLALRPAAQAVECDELVLPPSVLVSERACEAAAATQGAMVDLLDLYLPLTGLGVVPFAFAACPAAGGGSARGRA